MVRAGSSKRSATPEQVSGGPSVVTSFGVSNADLENNKCTHPPETRELKISEVVSDSTSPSAEQLLEAKNTNNLKMEQKDLLVKKHSPIPFLNLAPPSFPRRPTPLEALWSQPLYSAIVMKAPDVPSLAYISTPPYGPPQAYASSSSSPSPAPTLNGDALNAEIPEIPISLALQNFLDGLTIPSRHLAPIFIHHGFNSEVTLDLLCEFSPEGNWDYLKHDILMHGRLAGWLAVQHGLQQRAKSLQHGTQV